MKTMRFLLNTGTIFLALLSCYPAPGQVPEQGREAGPDEKWDVRKEYDEQGNLIFYDSSYSKTWQQYDFPGHGDWHVDPDLDSMFGDFFHFPENIFDHDAFSFHPFHKYMDSLNWDYYPDTLFFNRPYGFKPFSIFPDSAQMKSFFPDSMFQDAFVPFDKFFPHSFQGPDEFFKRHEDLMKKFRYEFSFPYDSLYQLHPKWQQWPGQQKKSPKGIEI